MAYFADSRPGYSKRAIITDKQARLVSDMYR